MQAPQPCGEDVPSEAKARRGGSTNSVAADKRPQSQFASQNHSNLDHQCAMNCLQVEETPVLDESEQNAVLDEFQSQAQAARRQTLWLIGPLGGALCLAYFYFSIQALLDPWSVRHHAELIDVLRPVSLAAAEALSGVAMSGSLAAVIANCRLQAGVGRSILQSAVLLTILVSIFWSMALAKMLRLRNYDLVRSWNKMKALRPALVAGFGNVSGRSFPSHCHRLVEQVQSLCSNRMALGECSGSLLPQRSGLSSACPSSTPFRAWRAT